MFCQNCGNQIPDDSTFCPECGAAIKSAKKPAANGGDFVKDLTSNPANIGVIAGGFFLFISTFMGWVSAFGISVSLFKADGIHPFFMVLLMLIGLAFIAWPLLQVIPATKAIGAKLEELDIIGTVLVIVAAVIIILEFFMRGGAPMSFTSIGFGWILALLSTIGIAVARGFRK